MRFVADLHIHSKYSYATSPRMVLPEIAAQAKRTGIDILGTGDITHPAWLKELRKYLEEEARGTFAYAGCRFFLNGEVSTIFRRNGRVRKAHLIVFVPDFKAAEKLQKGLERYGKLLSDGRPTLLLDCRDVVRMLLDISDESMLIPAHAWTPHFGIFGSAAGFDSLEECFGDEVKNIFAIETGLSSDPAMNWRLSALDNIALISNSDAHSLPSLGREANIFELSTGGLYRETANVLKTKDTKKFLSTVEFFPEEGKYHLDGHRAHHVRMTPEEAKKRRDICPVCGKKMTIGVLHRVDDLADRPEGARPEKCIPFVKAVPLDEIIAESLKVGKQSKKVQKELDRLIDVFGSELKILLDTPIRELARENAAVAEGVDKMRRGQVKVSPGYDGEYGTVNVL